jgi:hypothetical protein
LLFTLLFAKGFVVGLFIVGGSGDARRHR